MREIEINGLTLGNGRPWVIAPIISAERSAIIDKATELSKNPYVEMIEWRADCYRDIENRTEVFTVLRQMRQIVGRVPVVFSLRTKSEGGNCCISDDDYVDLNKAVAHEGLVDFVDLEVLSHSGMTECVSAVHETSCRVIGGRHYPESTPTRTEILVDFVNIQQSGADILKVVTMPTSRDDVLTLMAATNEMWDRYAKCPVIGISMGRLGMVSRLTSEFFGSSMTFGKIGDESGEGQIPVEQLNAVLNIIHNTYNGR